MISAVLTLGGLKYECCASEVVDARANSELWVAPCLNVSSSIAAPLVLCILGSAKAPGLRTRRAGGLIIQESAIVYV